MFQYKVKCREVDKNKNHPGKRVIKHGLQNIQMNQNISEALNRADYGYIRYDKKKTAEEENIQLMIQTAFIIYAVHLIQTSI